MESIIIDNQVLMYIDFDILFRANDDGSYCPITPVLFDSSFKGTDCLSPGQKIASRDIKDLVGRQLIVTLLPGGTVEVHRIH